MQNTTSPSACKSAYTKNALWGTECMGNKYIYRAEQSICIYKRVYACQKLNL